MRQGMETSSGDSDQQDIPHIEHSPQQMTLKQIPHRGIPHGTQEGK